MPRGSAVDRLAARAARWSANAARSANAPRPPRAFGPRPKPGNATPPASGAGSVRRREKIPTPADPTDPNARNAAKSRRAARSKRARDGARVYLAMLDETALGVLPLTTAAALFGIRRTHLAEAVMDGRVRTWNPAGDGSRALVYVVDALTLRERERGPAPTADARLAAVIAAMRADAVRWTARAGVPVPPPADRLSTPADGGRARARSHAGDAPALESDR